MSDRVVLTVPARGEYARTVRMAAGELASRAGMSLDDVEDLKLAAEEAFVLACGHAGLAAVTFSFELQDEAVVVEVGPLPASSDDGPADDTGERYARFILESVCDHYEMIERDGSLFARLEKRTG